MAINIKRCQILSVNHFDLEASAFLPGGSAPFCSQGLEQVMMGSHTQQEEPIASSLQNRGRYEMSARCMLGVRSSSVSGERVV